jgi:hypothetical protein
MMNQVFALQKLDKALDKTFIGKLDKGLDSLGYHFGNCTFDVVSIAKKTRINHQDKLARLYEYCAGKKVLREIRGDGGFGLGVWCRWWGDPGFRSGVWADMSV